MPQPPTGAALPPAILANRAEFLGFLERRLGRRDAAEEVLQAAYLKAMESAAPLVHEESAVAWFYRLLRNALIDRHRRLTAEDRALARHAGELETDAPDEPLHGAVCRCIDGVLPTLKPAYVQILRKVDLGGDSVPEAASHLGITANNAAVRLHRARAALKAGLQATCGACSEHGCLDCDCRHPKGGARPGVDSL